MVYRLCEDLSCSRAYAPLLLYFQKLNEMVRWDWNALHCKDGRVVFFSFITQIGSLENIQMIIYVYVQRSRFMVKRVLFQCLVHF